MQIAITTLFFKLFGVSEFSARIPSVLLGSIGIVFAYLLASKLSNRAGGLLAAFLYAFSQLNISNATQAKPYATLETLLLMICYLLLVKKSSYFQSLISNMFVIFLLTLSTFIHYVGVMFWIIYIVNLVLSHSGLLIKKIRQPIFMISGFVLFSIFLHLFNIDQLILDLFKTYNGKVLLISDNTIHLKNLLIRQYGIFFLPAIITLLISFKKNKAIVVALFFWIIVLLFMWSFRIYSHSIRYLVPLFGIIFTLFGAFFGIVGERYFKRFNWVLCLIVAVLLMVFQYKIILRATNYYTPNADFYGDVQIADYKKFYEELKIRFPNYKKLYIVNDTFDVEDWYLGRYSNSYFMKFTIKPYKHPLVNAFVYKSLPNFRKIIKNHPEGIVIVEDWDSFLPEEIKQYARKNLKLEMRIEGLPQAMGDNWPLEVYSWGFEK